LIGDIPAGRVHELQQYVPALTSGEGALECVFDRHEEVHGKPPTRPRTDNSPLDRKEYLVRLGKWA
jgi:ribosomal protection tetracycline resistance protein